MPIAADTRGYRREFLDHDYIIDSKMNAYVIVGNRHPPGGVFAYKKYTIRPPTVHPWRRPGYTFERAFREYSPAVARQAEHAFYYISPEDGTIFPLVSTSRVLFHLKPELGLKALFHRTSDPLEERILDLARALHREIGVPYEKIGVTGSVLLGIHNPEKSDIDMVVYDCSYKKAIEDRGLLEPLRGRELEQWLVKAARRLKLPRMVVERLYDPSRRGYFEGSLTTIVYVQPAGTRYGQNVKPPTVYLGLITVKVELARLDCTHHYFPHLARGFVRGVVRGPRGILDLPVEIAVYETLYSSAIDRCSHVIVTGKAIQHGNAHLRIVVGTRESTTTILPAA